jgi:hypothetical protein
MCEINSNPIISAYKSDPLLFRLQVKLFKSTIHHPKFSFVCKQIPGIVNTLDPDGVKALVLKYKKINYGIFDTVSTDQELEVAIGQELYLLFSHIVLDNYFATRTLKQIPWKENQDFKFKLVTSPETKDGSAHIITFDYTASQEEKFSNGSNWLFHGSGIYSWHWILKYGLKVMSKTPAQLNGAAYGSGIYMSDKYETSYSYSSRTNLDKIVVVGVFQVVRPISAYRKAPGIFVIPSESEILLRYLIVVPSKKNCSAPDMPSITELMGQIMDKITNKRLGIEYKLLESNPLVDTIQVITQDKKWIIKLKSGLEVQMDFNKYPIVPPSIKLNGIDLLLPITNPSTWTVTNKLTDIINQIET